MPDSKLAEEDRIFIGPKTSLDQVPFMALIAIRERLGLSPEAFGEMPVGEVMSRLAGYRAYESRKWSRGELRSMVADWNDGACLEVVGALVERGPRVVAWDDESDPELDRMKAAEAKEFAGEEYDNK
jgi:hypothetical protein